MFQNREAEITKSLIISYILKEKIRKAESGVNKMQLN